MNFGFNSNVRVGDATYHVQTEDRGPSHPFLDTVVYMAGRVIYKRSASYEKFASGTEAETLAQRLHERLARQHREVITELEAGTLPIHGKDKGPSAAEIAYTSDGPENAGTHESAKSTDSHDAFDLRLLNPKNWLAAGNAILEIELCEKHSQKRVGGAEVEACLEHEKHRIPCAEMRSDTKGCVTLKFPMPPNVADGSCLVVRATVGSRQGELRFRLKSKARDKAQAGISH